MHFFLPLILVGGSILKTLIIKDLSKSFPINKVHSFYALKNINLYFDEVGFNSIIGKSGSGKTTLLNMISQFDKPTKGEIYLNKNKYKTKNNKKYLFYRDEVGIVSQNYNLLTNLTVLENVMMPLLISGCSKTKSYNKAVKLLMFVNIPNELFNVKADRLSGGESQRVAIARALIRNPKIILCDEPTGALDSENSIKVMELLSKISKSRLVIMVSHNLQLVEKYSDRIIEISDGVIINDRKNKTIEKQIEIGNEPINGHRGWTSKFSVKNFGRRFKRNLFIISSLTFSMLITNLVVGFINGKDIAIKNSCYRQLDFGSGSISKDELVSDTGIIKLTKSIRPDLAELSTNEKITNLFNICPNFSAILPQNIKIQYDEVDIDDVLYTPIYSFEDSSIDRSLLEKGEIPLDSLNAVVINKSFYNKMKEISNVDPLNDNIHLSHHFESIYVNEYEDYITDYFDYDVTVTIAGVVDELTYLNSPKIYYSYLALESYLQDYALINLSTYYDSKITWFDRVMNAENYSMISSYSYQLYLKDFSYRSSLFDESIFGEYSFNSTSLVISNSLIGFLSAAEYALLLFLIIGIAGTILILTIISFTNYSEDRKISAILSSLGAKNSDIENIYVNENLYSGLLSLILSFALSFPLSILINKLLFRYLSVSNMIKIPFLSYKSIPLFYPLLILVIMVALIYIATLLPIRFSKRTSLSLELKAND